MRERKRGREKREDAEGEEEEGGWGAVKEGAGRKEDRRKERDRVLGLIGMFWRVAEYAT